MSDVYSTEEIARHVAESMGLGVDHPWADWRSFHPIVKATINWLDDHNFLAIVDEQPTGLGTGIPPEGP